METQGQWDSPEIQRYEYEITKAQWPCVFTQGYFIWYDSRVQNPRHEVYEHCEHGVTHSIDSAAAGIREGRPLAFCETPPLSFVEPPGGGSVIPPVRKRGRFPSTAMLWFLLLGLTALGGFLRFWRLGYQTYWTDESATIGRIRGSFEYMLMRLSDQGFPPGWYAMLRAWCIGIENYTGSGAFAFSTAATARCRRYLGRSPCPRCISSRSSRIAAARSS